MATPPSPALGGGSRRDDNGGQLLKELEALSQALYNAGQHSGPPPRNEATSPNLGSISDNRRQDPVSPFLGTRRNESQSPHAGRYGSRRESRSEEPPSPYFGARRDGPPSPYLGSLGSRSEEPRSPRIFSLNAQRADPMSPYLGRLGSRGDSAGRLIEPVSPYLGGKDSRSPGAGSRLREEGSSTPYHEGRREEPKSPYLGARSGEEPQSPSLRSWRGEQPSPYLGSRREGSPYLSRIEEATNLYERNDRGTPVPYGGPARSVSETLARPGKITPLTLSSAAVAASRSPHKRPPIPSRSFSSPAPTAKPGKKFETYRQDPQRESLNTDSLGRVLRPWHSQSFEKNLPEVTNFSAWLEDNLEFSKKLEAPKEKKSFWNWKPFRAIAHIGHQRFNCMFTLHVHGIEGLPAVLNGLRLTVSWKRRESSTQTMPSRVFQGSVEFEETLNLKSTVYGSKNGTHAMKYMPKNFELAVFALDVDELVLGKHRLDLSRLLPESSDGKTDEENGNSWTTSFKLTGKAQGGTLVVTFGHQLLNKEFQPTSNLSSARFGDSPMMKTMRSYNSLPNSPKGIMKGGRASDVQFTPAFSEMSNSEFLNMEPLSLDESVENPFSSGRSSQIGKGRPNFKAFATGQRDLTFHLDSEFVIGPRTTQQYEDEELGTEMEEAKTIAGLEDGEEEDKEFTVTHQGIEVSTIYNPGLPTEYDDQDAEEDTVQGLGETDLHEEVLVEDSTAGSADVSDKVDALSEEDISQAEDVGADISFQRADSRTENLDESGEAVWRAESPPGDDIQIEDVALEPDEEVEKNQQEKKSNDGHDHKHEDEQGLEMGVVDAQEGGQQGEDLGAETKESSEETVKDLAELSRSRAANSPALLMQKNSISREELQSGGRGTEVTRLARNENVAVVETSKTEEVEELQIVVKTVSIPVEQEEVEQIEMDADEDLDLVAREFLSLLEDEKGSVGMSSESGEDSPRALLLQQFEQEALSESGLGLNFHLPEHSKFTLEGIMHAKLNLDSAAGKTFLSEELNTSGWGSEEDVEFASIMEAAEVELQKATQFLRSKTRAKMLEDAESEALMQEWGLDAKDFEKSPPRRPALDNYDYGSALVPASMAPSLGRGLGPVLQVRDGGSLRSMSPVHFEATGESSRLLMQVSNPIVVPSKMGTTSMDILRQMAAAGMEGMAAQAIMAMPLEDITGKTLDQVFVEGRAAGKSYWNGNRRNGYAALGYGEIDTREPSRGYRDPSHTGVSAVSTISLYRADRSSRNRSSCVANSSDEYRSLQDLAPLAMQRIEALALEGLKVQSEMAEEEAPYSVDPLSWQERAALEGGPDVKIASLGVNMLEGAAGLPLFEAGSGNDDDDLMSMVISLDEWMRLDAGVCNENEPEENTLAILAAHKAAHKDVVIHGKQADNERGVQTSGARGDKSKINGGFMGDLTLAMLVQLRDPLRNNELVGAPMMALVQAERLVVPPRPKLGRRVTMTGNNEKADTPAQPPQFKLVEVTISGFKTSEDSTERKKGVWTNQKQLQTGSRWLIANGMTKSTKSLKGKAPVQVRKGESLWSISARVHGTGMKRQEVAKLNPQIRNPDIIFANTTIRTR